MGIPKRAFQEDRWIKRYDITLSYLYNSIRKHYRNISNPKPGVKAFDVIVFDFNNFDDFNPNLRTQVSDYVKHEFNEEFKSGKIIFIN